MSQRKRCDLSADEQPMLENGSLRRLTRPEDFARGDPLMVQPPYLHSVSRVGEHLRDAFVYRGQGRAVAPGSSAAFPLQDRDAFIGWEPEQGRRRLGTAGQQRAPLGAARRSFAQSPQPLHETQVGGSLGRLARARGTPAGPGRNLCRSALLPRHGRPGQGLVAPGTHGGGEREADDFYEKHEAPKQVGGRARVKKACLQLRATQLPLAGAKVEATVPPRCPAKGAQIQSWMESGRAEGPEFRRAEALGYPGAGLACLTVMAVAPGGARGPPDRAQYADTLSPAQLRAWRFRRDAHPQVRCPKQTTLTRFLHGADDDALERGLLRGQDPLWGPTQDRWVIIDGKKVRHGGGEIGNAVDGAGRFLGSGVPPAQRKEIPAARQRRRPQNLVDKTVIAEARPPPPETAQQILYEPGGDDLLTVKANPPTLPSTLQSRFAQQAFSPSAPRTD